MWVVRRCCGMASCKTDCVKGKTIVPSGSSMVLGSYPGGHPLENGHMEVHGSVLGAHTQGETHRQNDTSLAGRPKDTNPYPGRDPYRGIHKGGRPPKAAAPLCGGGAKRRLLYGWVCGGWGGSRRGRNTRKRAQNMHMHAHSTCDV